MRMHCRATLVGAVIVAVCQAQSGWTLLQPANQPQARSYIAMVYDVVHGKIVLFGGLGFGDTWTWDGTNWSQAAPATSPPARCCNALAYDAARARVVLFGGTTGAAFTDFGDTWEYDGTTWSQRQPVHAPSPRRFATAEYDWLRSRVVLFGGGATGYGAPMHGDTWEWDGNDWTQRNPTVSPPARWAHGLSFDLTRGRLVLTGGLAVNQGATLSDTWAFDGNAWTQLSTSSWNGASTGTAYDATRDLIVDIGFVTSIVAAPTRVFDGSAWRNDPRSGGPLSRTWAALVHDFLRGHTILFGGFPNETWKYEPGPVARWQTFGVGCAGTSGTPLLRAAPGSLPIPGTTFVQQLMHAAATVGVIAIGFSDQQWMTNALPWSLASLGMPGCTMYASPDVPVFVTFSVGTATLSWTLPNDPTLTGVRFFAQGYVLAPGVNPMGAVVSNPRAGVIGPF